MDLLELCKGIQLQEEITGKVFEIAEHMDFVLLEAQMNQLMDRKTAPKAYADLKEYFHEDEDNLNLLVCNLTCAVRIYEKYQEKNISDEIFFDTMKCFTRFIWECKEKTGRFFFGRDWWTYRQVSMSLFRIGELEYEMTAVDGEKVISMHIPSDAVFTEELVDSSLTMARDFFAEHFPEYTGCNYVCNSWLLSPKLRLLLGEASNIIRFQERFDLISTDPLDREFVEWLFQAPVQTNYDELKENTSLQRKAKKMLLQGEKIGSGYGILR